MNDRRTQTVGNNIVTIALAIAAALTLTETVSAQGNSRSRSTRDVEAAARERQRQVQNRSMAMQHLGDEKKLKREQAQLLTRIREDFMRLQVVNNEMLQAVYHSESLDYKLISDATEEISKCAKRLKSNLAVPDVEKDKQQQKAVESHDEKIKGSLERLDNSIMSFVTSLGVVNTQDVTKVSRDLTDIIEISNSIKKNAEKLSKTSQTQK